MNYEIVYLTHRNGTPVYTYEATTRDKDTAIELALRHKGTASPVGGEFDRHWIVEFSSFERLGAGR